MGAADPGPVYAMITCPLCGAEFDADRDNCHTSCAFNRNCTMIKCPYCDYEFLTESRTVNFLKTLFHRGRKEDADRIAPGR